MSYLLDTDICSAYLKGDRRFGEMRAVQLDQGQVTPDMDLLIASTALVNGLVLVTHNVQDFANVPALTIEDWLAP